MELMLAMLEVDSDFECPRPVLPALPAVGARVRPPAWRTLSVRICLWNLVPVAARESMGISSFTCTVWACCRRLSRREKRLEQWHWNGRSPVCFLCSCQDLERTDPAFRSYKNRAAYLMCLARCSLRVKLRLQGG